MSGIAPGEPPDEPRPEPLRAVEEAVARAVASNALWPTDATVVVALSGGADSLCLLGAAGDAGRWASGRAG